MEAFAPAHGNQPETRLSGTETARSIGGLWLLLEGHSEMPGGGMAHTLMTLRYDEHRSEFIGTWVGSTMNVLWHYHGQLDEAAQTLTLCCEGPVFDTGEPCEPANTFKTTQYRDIIRIVDAQTRTLTSMVLTRDGQWT